MDSEAFLTCDLRPSGSCTVRPGAAFEQQVCIRRPDAHDCPEDFPTKFTTVLDVSDTRSCNNDCNCNAGSVACNGAVKLHSQPGCGSQVTELALGACANVGSFTSQSIEYVPNPTGACAQSGGTVSGTIASTSVETVCCTAQ